MLANPMNLLFQLNKMCRNNINILIRFYLFYIINIFLSCKNYNFTNESKYKVNENIQKVIFNEVDTTNNIEGFCRATLYFKKYDVNTTNKPDTIKFQKLNSFIFSTYDHEKIYINCFYGIFQKFGYDLTIFKDSFSLNYTSLQEGKVYKIKLLDTLDNVLILHCKNKTLTLTKKPTFKKGEQISGMLKLSTPEYYEVINGKQSLNKIEIISYFNLSKECDMR